MLRNASVFDSLAESLSGPPNDDQKVKSGLLVSGCRLHSCDEKGAILLDSHGRVEAVAILNFGCQFKKPEPSECMADPRLSMFLPRSMRSELLTKELQNWALDQEGHAVPQETVWLPWPRLR